MSKTSKAYKIFMTSMVAIIAGLLLASGIIAIQKSIKVKMDIEFLPGVNVEIYVKNDDNPTEKLIFSNYEEGANGIYVDSIYCSLSANTLTFNNNFVTAYGNNFTLVVKNYSDFTIETNITSTATAKIGDDSINAVEPEITPATAQIAAGESGEFEVSCEPVIPQETTLTLQFEEGMPNEIYATINVFDQKIGEYFSKSTEQIITIDYPSTFTYAGDLMSAVSGVSKVTATQITIAANTTGPITIVPKGYTIGTYTNDSSDVAYNAVYSVENLKATEIYYTPYAGYKYIQFNGAESYDDSGTLRHLRWIIIGSATGDTTTYGEGGNVNPFTLDSSANETTTKELLDNECLMLSEQVIEEKAFDASYTSSQWNADTNDIRIWLNGEFLTSTGLTNYKGSKIKPKNLYTSFETNKNETSKNATYTSINDYMFLLAHHYNATASTKCSSYYLQDYMMQRYLGDVGSSNGKIHTFSGASSCWWLRSGYYNSSNLAYYVYSDGYLYSDRVNYSGGVRPSFILNLA